MPFVKLDCGIADSTIFCEPNEVFKAWITLLIKAGPDGVARITAPALGLLCRVDTTRAMEILKQFEGPDENSRTKDDDGARIRRVDGGYLILNYQKYRAKRDDGERQMQNREAQRRHRERASMSATVSHGQPMSAQAEAEAEAEKRRKLEKPKIAPDGATANADHEKPEAAPTLETRQRDVVWESMLQACGIPATAHLPKSARNAYNRACADLRSVGADVEQIYAHADAFRRMWPQMTLTPTALVRRWNEVVSQRRILGARNAM